MDLGFLKDLSSARLLVAGEVGIDEYLWGDTRRISPEAPVPVVEVESESAGLGLAGNVAQNVASLGAHVTLVTVRGRDTHGERLDGLLSAAGIRDTVFLTDPSRPTPRKVRVIAGRQHVVRVDYERVHPLDDALTARFTESLCDRLGDADGVIVQDYGKGLWNAATMAFVKEARAKKKPVFVDPARTSPLALYRGATLLTPNVAETEILCGMADGSPKNAGKDDARLLAMASKLLAGAESDHAVITCGEWGMVALTRGERELQRIPTFARSVFDVTGAGDTVIAVLSLMYVLGHPLATCMRVANAAAGIVVGQIGAASVSPAELRAEILRLEAAGWSPGERPAAPARPGVAPTLRPSV